MKRRWFLILGIILVVSQTAILAAFGIPPVFESGPAATVVIIAFAGIFFMLGGSGRQFWGVEWHQFMGAGQILIGLSLATSILLPILNGTSAYESGIRPFLAVAAAIGGALVMFMGFDWIRGGRHFDLSTFEPRPILASERE